MFRCQTGSEDVRKQVSEWNSDVSLFHLVLHVPKETSLTNELQGYLPFSRLIAEPLARLGRAGTAYSPLTSSLLATPIGGVIVDLHWLTVTKETGKPARHDVCDAKTVELCPFCV